jgi:hypothetical protein
MAEKEKLQDLVNRRQKSLAKKIDLLAKKQGGERVKAASEMRKTRKLLKRAQRQVLKLKKLEAPSPAAADAAAAAPAEPKKA